MNNRVKRLEFCETFTLILVICLIIISIILGVYFSLWNGIVDTRCNDYNLCTIDKRLPDSSCINRLYLNGTSCSIGNVCYNSSASPICIDGLCIDQPIFCRGYCNEDADCPDLPWDPRLDSTPS